MILASGRVGDCSAALMSSEVVYEPCRLLLISGREAGDKDLNTNKPFFCGRSKLSSRLPSTTAVESTAQPTGAYRRKSAVGFAAAEAYSSHHVQQRVTGI